MLWVLVKAILIRRPRRVLSLGVPREHLCLDCSSAGRSGNCEAFKDLSVVGIDAVCLKGFKNIEGSHTLIFPSCRVVIDTSRG